MAAVPLLAIERASKRFGSTVALDDVSVDVAPGEFFALLGPSGCGKTTLMRLIAGFERPDSGRLTLEGRDLAGLPPHQRPINMMFQSYALFPHLDVFENIAFGLRRKGLAQDDVKKRVQELLDVVQLGGFNARRIHQLSGGQKQRVALARALAPGPKLLLLDEPLGALDRKLREETQLQLKQIQRKLNTAFVIVTHDQDEALALADRIAVMRAGKIEQIGAPPDVYRRPQNRFVADFIGATNLIEGHVSRADGVWFVAPFGKIARAVCTLDDGARAALSLRPQDIRLARDGAGLPGRVAQASFRGETTLLWVELDTGGTLRVSCPPDAGLAQGDSVRVTIPPEAGALLAEPRP
ncbi:ABC transporter ATP-binding protein [Methylocystis bryophila]|uniref:Polyamine ABC transporter ATP-binding protein n=1 Tax=Methylocystis bryophila TaxID=655015 RepID=A0A1W6MQV5_9HYPH|nr:ABC transporter ATP-binding protein [Methylocystis bryophila]ARN79990.1 polyamine ABC transporter ATP-binding protein [Methylocystis bryophila]BDV39898.1 polyamine-transporting ATPase [Methylocystis bryophila]